MSTLAKTCGQLVVGGYVGVDPTPTFLSAMRRGHRAGAILFRRNLPAWEAGHDAARQLVEAAGSLSPIVAVDQEGGRVQRLRSPFIEVPSMRRLASGGESLVLATARCVGAQLAALGFNVDFAPVLDVDTNPDNPVIGDRSFSRDARQVARLGAHWIRGLQESGVAGCGKHFPGHGDTSVDSHLALPVVDNSQQRLRDVELVPFRAAIEAGVEAIMSAHIVVRAIDGSVPATLCPAIIGGVLRDELGFCGVVFSDDLEMRAIAGRYEVGGAAVAAVRAGCDVVLVCKEEGLQEEAHGALVAEAERDQDFRRRCEESAERSRALRRRRSARPAPGKSEVRELFDASEALQTQLRALEQV